MENSNESIIALLIDADNVGVKYIDGIINEITKHGKISIRRIYGDWSKDSLKYWLESVNKYSLIPVMQENNIKGKNASDICIVIDALEFLYERNVDVFCIVSSDSDFTRLAKKLRESGKTVIGMGERKTSLSFRNSCERFIFLDVIMDSDEDMEKDKTATDTLEAQKNGSMDTEAAVTEETVTEDIIEKTIEKIIIDNNSLGKKTGVAEVGSRLTKIYPDFDVRNYGYNKLSAFISGFGNLEMIKKGSSLFVKLKSTMAVNVEDVISGIFKDYKKNRMNMGELKKRMKEEIPDLDIMIKNEGISKFSKYLQRNVRTVELDEKGNAIFTAEQK